jgi:Mrp family chromosome partitioning ATPase
VPRPPAAFVVRFEPVHAARQPGRGFAPEVLAVHDPDGPAALQYSALAAEIGRQLPGALPRVVVFTAAAAGAGTSTVVLNLAAALARQDGTRVTVVDAHPARPALAALTGVAAAPGWRDALALALPVAWCVQATALPNLAVVAAGAAGARPAAVAPAGLLEALRERSGWVLVDAPPWPESADLTDACDAVYLVQPLVADAAAVRADLLARTGRLRGCVLTGA